MSKHAFLMRFTNGLTKSGTRMLTVWDPEHNLLQIDLELYEGLEHLDQMIVERSYRDIVAGEKFRD